MSYVLCKVRLFGWNPVDWEEEQALRAMFDDLDKGNDGTLNKSEISDLFVALNLHLTHEQFERLYNELDLYNTGEIDYHEFKHWWYKKKNGKPHMDRCPSKFLDILAMKLVTRAYDIDEDLVEHGDYGRSFGIILEGEVRLWRDWARKLKPEVIQVLKVMRAHQM